MAAMMTSSSSSCASSLMTMGGSISSRRGFTSSSSSSSSSRTTTTTLQRRRRDQQQIIHAAASSESIEKAKESGLVLAEFEKEEVIKVREQLRANHSEEISGVENDIADWFVRDRKLDGEAALKKIVKYQTWREENFSKESLNAPSVIEEGKTGKAVLMKERDVLGRPVVLVTLIKHEVATRVLEDTQKLCVKLLDEGLEELKNEGFEQETVMCVYDLRGFSMKNADIDFTKFFISCIFDYYPKRISQVLLVEAPFVFKPVWGIIKPLMGKYSSLVKFVKAKEANEFFESEPF
ncbi:unnamed protein product [Bathycoccus prasinos]|jgi:hypothetical protein